MNIQSGIPQAAVAAEADMANAIRALAMDAVQKANSGHPGMPMGMADVATVLFNRFIKLDPAKPDWPDRDRFVLSAGHGSMLQYAHPLSARLCRHDRGGAEALPPARLAHRRTPGIRPRARHRDDHRPAGAGAGDVGRHGAGGADDGGPFRRRPRRSLHLCHRRRRLPAGGHQPRSDRSGGASEAVPADRVLGRQQYIHRRPDLPLHVDGPAGAVHSRRLGRPARRRPRQGSGRRRHCEGAGDAIRRPSSPARR